MKILEITNVDFSLRHFLLPLMRGARARGHEVVGVCADGPLLADVRADGFRVETVPLERSFSPAALLRGYLALTALCAREKPDLVHAHMPISGVLARVAARATGVPTVAYTCHGFLFNQPAPWPRRAASLVLEWLAGRITDIFLTVSADEAEDALRLGIARRPIAVGNGRDPTEFHPNVEARKAVRADLGVTSNTVVIIAVSRLVRHKGYPELLSAMREVPAELWVVGERLSSDRGENLEPYFARAESAVRLRRLGYRTDIAALLAASDIFVLPSYFEGLPMSTIEAMLTGLPVVATNIRGPREQIVDGETGLLVPRGAVAPLTAALTRLATDEDLRQRMGVRARARAVRLYGEAEVVARTLDVMGVYQQSAPTPLAGTGFAA